LSDQVLTGTYVLLLQLSEVQTVTVGRLGTFDFPPGWYTYVGSAFGAGGILGRLKHHLRPVEKPHWHIDYLRQYAPVVEIWLAPDTERREADWVDLMFAVPGATTLIEGFGASDSSREAHLFYFDLKPSLEDFAVGVRARFPNMQLLRAFTGDNADA
jgi:Uri superfamily endonuclease